MNLGKETELQEFKKSLTQLDKGIKSLSAMLNRHGKGTVFFGVEDDGEVVGVSLGEHTLMDIRNKIRDMIEPQVISEIQDLSDEKGNIYIRVSAQGTDIPYSCDGRYFVRNVTSDEHASNELLRKMLANSEADILCQITSSDQELTFEYLFSLMESKNIHTRETPSFYSNYHMLNSEGRFNLMAYLLSDQNAMSIKVIRFAGTDKSVMSERKEFTTQSLLKTASQVLEYFSSFNTAKVDLSSGVRKEAPLFHLEAFREAWINACVHTAWGEQIPPAIYVFDDRIEVVSNGGLPYGLSKEGFYKGTSIPVNKSLFTIFMLLGLAEQSGHGIPIIVSEYGKEIFSFEDGMLKVTIPFAFVLDNIAHKQIATQTSVKFTDKEYKVYLCMKENAYISLQELADRVGISLGGVKKMVAKLKREGVVTRSGSKKTGKWEIR